MKSFFALGTALALAFAAPASAAQIIYTFTGNVTASVNGNLFPPAASVFTAIGNTDTLAEVFPGTFAVDLSSFSATSGGNGFTFAGAAQFVFTPIDNSAGIVIDGFTLPIFFNGIGNYNGISDFATADVSFDGSLGQFATSAGTVTVVDITELTFSADVEDAAAAVPEPATWGMMLLGFGMVGAGIRRRKTPLVTA